MPSQTIMMYEGYHRRGGKKRRSGGKRKSGRSVAANRKRFGAASRACFKSTESWSAFGKCMRKSLKRGR